MGNPAGASSSQTKVRTLLSTKLHSKEHRGRGKDNENGCEEDKDAETNIEDEKCNHAEDIDAEDD